MQIVDLFFLMYFKVLEWTVNHTVVNLASKNRRF